MKHTITYSLKVWLISVVVSPVLYVIIEAIQKPRIYQNIEGSLGFILYSIPYGLVLSLVSWLLLWLSLCSLLMLKMSIKVTKLWLSLICTVLTLFPFWLIFGHDDANSLNGIGALAASYYLVILGGVWFYKLKPLV